MLWDSPQEAFTWSRNVPVCISRAVVTPSLEASQELTWGGGTTAVGISSSSLSWRYL